MHNYTYMRAQVALLAFFYMVATRRFWYNYSLLLLSLLAGLLGGGVYVGECH
jgi:hypothetical protein